MSFTLDAYGVPNLGSMLGGQLQKAFGQAFGPSWGQGETAPAQGNVPSLFQTLGIPQAGMSTAPVPSLASGAPQTPEQSPSLFKTLVGDRDSTDLGSRLGVAGQLGLMGEVMAAQTPTLKPMQFAPIQPARGPTLMDFLNSYQAGGWGS